VGSEDIRDLQGRARHALGLSRRLEFQILQWAFNLMQELGRNMAIAGGILEALVTQEHLDDTDILVVF
jgi:hypothetical protein